MKKELEDKAFVILDKMLDAVNSGVDKAPEFLAGLAEEYGIYFAIENAPILSLYFFVISAVLFIWAIRSVVKGFKTANLEDKDTYFFCITTTFIALLVAGSFLIDGSKDIIQAIYAPKAFLIENVRK